MNIIVGMLCVINLLLSIAFRDYAQDNFVWYGWLADMYVWAYMIINGIVGLACIQQAVKDISK